MFGNGLVLKNINILETKYEKSEAFNNYVISYLNNEKERAKKKVQM